MPSTSYCDITSLRVALVQHAAEIAVTVLGEPNLRLCSSGRELRFGNRGSLAIAINGPKAGQWYDHETGEGGDLIDRRRERCCSFRDATTYAEELIGTAPRRCRRSLGRAQKPISSYDESGTKRALRLLSEGVPIGDTPAAAFLNWRGVLSLQLNSAKRRCGFTRTAHLVKARDIRACSPSCGTSLVMNLVPFNALRSPKL
jgi:hypothetical protein